MARLNLCHSALWIALILSGWIMYLTDGQGREGAKTSSRCGTPSPYTFCGCDIACCYYGDCCPNILSNCGNITGVRRNDSFISNHFEEKYEQLNFNTICIEVERLVKTETDMYPSKFLMVAKCPEKWRDEEIRNLCIGNGSDDILSLLPVQDTSGVIFKNTFCAYCHGYSPDYVIPWRLIRNNITDDEAIHPPRSHWSMNLQICDNERERYIRSCPEGTPKQLSENCSSHLEPIQVNSTKKLYVKNEYCAKCHNVTSNLLRHNSPIVLTYDVIFGFNSWGTFRGSCEEEELDYHFKQDIFQNACDLFKLLREEDREPSCDILTCLSDLTQPLFLSDGNNSLRIRVTNRSCDSLEAEITLPSMLAYIVLNNTIKTEKVSLACDVKVTAVLPVAKLPSTCDSFNREHNRHQSLVTIDCHDICRLTAIYLPLSSCPQYFSMSTQLKCYQVVEPFVKFRVIDFVKEEIEYLPTKVILDRDQFVVTPESQIISCEEYLQHSLLQITKIVQIIGSCSSISGMLAVIALHFIFPKLQTLYGFCLVNLCVAYLLLFIFLLANALVRNIHLLAQAFVMLCHYTFIAIFAWQKVITFHVARSFGKNIIANRMNKISVKKEAILYSCLAWGTPLPFVIAGVALHICACTKFSYGDVWMLPSTPTTILFILPLSVFVFLSAILFSIALMNIRRRQHTSTVASNAKLNNFFVALRLAIITGLPWLFIIILSQFHETFLLPLITAILALQGVFIFLAFVTTKNVRRMIFKKLPSRHLNGSSNVKNIGTEE